MKKTIVFLMAILGSFGLNAQTSGQVATYTAGGGVSGASDALYNYAVGSISDKDSKTSLIDDSIEGSPYMSNSFAPGQLYYGNELVGNLFYRYNAYNEEVEIKQNNVEGETIRGLGKDKKIRLIALGKSMSFKTFIDKNGNTKNGYLTLMYDGEYKLYKHLKVTFKEAKKAPNSFVQGTPAKFSQFTEYYLESADGKRIDEVELSNKKLIQLVGGDKANELKSFLKKNKLKVNNENDLYKVMEFING